MRRQTGFTLVEIAIVMIVIGLLLGGVLKGQGVITNARLKRVVSDYNQLATALAIYRDRYYALPGDDATASEKFGNTVPNGNGNGRITGSFKTESDQLESRLFWRHLRAAGLVSGSTNHATAFAQATHPWGGKAGIEFGIYHFPNNAICFESITGDIASILDIQQDDGSANTGGVQGSADQANYVATASYDLCFEI